MPFFLDTNRKVNMHGASLINTHPDVIKSKKKGVFQKVNVTSVDVARLIRQYSKDDIIVVKMDIEGAEYELVIDWVKKDALAYIDQFACEFHGGFSKLWGKDVGPGFQSIIQFYG